MTVWHRKWCLANLATYDVEWSIPHKLDAPHQNFPILKPPKQLHMPQIHRSLRCQRVVVGSDGMTVSCRKPVVIGTYCCRLVPQPDSDRMRVTAGLHLAVIVCEFHTHLKPRGSCPWAFGDGKRSLLGWVCSGWEGGERWGCGLYCSLDITGFITNQQWYSGAAAGLSQGPTLAYHCR